MKVRSKLGISAVILLVSGFVCKALGALFRLPLTNLIGIEGIGIFQLVMSLYSFALVATCGGVTVALSKLISSARAKGHSEKIRSYIQRSLLVGVGIGLALGLVFLLFGNLISSLQGIDAGGSYLFFIILLPLCEGLASMRGFFQGYENMFPTAISQVVEQVFKFVFGLLFAFYFGRLGTSQGVFGAFLGITLSEVLAFIYIFILYLFKNKNFGKGERNFLARREFDRANFPLMLSASIIPLTNALDGLFIVARLILAGFSGAVATKLYGLQTGIVGTILNFPLIISMAVTTAFLPNISYLISRGTGGRFVIEKGLKLLLFLILPTTFGLVAISKPFLTLIYPDIGELLTTAFWLMFYGGFSVVFTALMQYFLMLLQANGQFRFILLITALGGILKILLAFFLSSLSSINIFSLVIGNLVLSAFVSVLALWRLKKLVGFRIPLGEILCVLFATFAMFLAVYTFVLSAKFNPILNVGIGILIGVFVYGVLTIPFMLKLSPKKIKEKV